MPFGRPQTAFSRTRRDCLTFGVNKKDAVPMTWSLVNIARSVYGPVLYLGQAPRKRCRAQPARTATRLLPQSSAPTPGRRFQPGRHRRWEVLYPWSGRGHQTPHARCRPAARWSVRRTWPPRRWPATTARWPVPRCVCRRLSWPPTDRHRRMTTRLHHWQRSGALYRQRAEIIALDTRSHRRRTG